MAYDSKRGRTVLFGGCCGTTGDGLLGDTWEWDGTSWTEQHPVDSPPPRMSEGMAFDSKRDVTVLFGGVDPALGMNFGDTWEWDGTNWTKRVSAVSPPPRAQMDLVYDTKRHATVVFGGVINCKGPSCLRHGVHQRAATAAGDGAPPVLYVAD